MQHHAFTTRYNGRARVLFNEVNVCLPVTPEEAQTQKVEFKRYAVTNANGKTTFSFRVPSVQEIDFIPDVQENNVMEGGNRQQRRAFQAKKRKGLI